MRNQSFVCFFAACALALSACGQSTVKETLGLDREPPDETRVVARPPLSVPPQFELRPPGIPGESSEKYSADAQSLVTGSLPADTSTQPVSSSDLAPADQKLLENAGARQADPNVRRDLAEQKLMKKQEEEEAGWWDKLSVFPEKEESEVDAKKEAERIKKNEEEGKPVTEGDTPETGGKEKSVLGRILGD